MTRSASHAQCRLAEAAAQTPAAETRCPSETRGASTERNTFGAHAICETHSPRKERDFSSVHRACEKPGFSGDCRSCGYLHACPPLAARAGTPAEAATGHALLTPLAMERPPQSAAVYDGSFEGLLSVVFDAYTEKKFPDIVLPPNEIPPLTVSEKRSVITERAKADRVFTGLARRLSLVGKNTLLLAFLSEEAGSSTHLFRYMRTVFDRLSSPEHDYADPAILTVDKLAKAVHGESLLLRGFTRFQKTTEGIYCGLIGPKYNVLTLLLSHFTTRFATHPWMLYDAVRQYGFYHDTKTLANVSLDPDLVRDGKLAEHLLDGDEMAFQSLWKTYFSSATIGERLNPVLQARCLPRRFWRYMTEMRP